MIGTTITVLNTLAFLVKAHLSQLSVSDGLVILPFLPLTERLQLHKGPFENLVKL